MHEHKRCMQPLMRLAMPHGVAAVRRWLTPPDKRSQAQLTMHRYVGCCSCDGVCMQRSINVSRGTDVGAWPWRIYKLVFVLRPLRPLVDQILTAWHCATAWHVQHWMSSQQLDQHQILLHHRILYVFVCPASIRSFTVARFYRTHLQLHCKDYVISHQLVCFIAKVFLSDCRNLLSVRKLKEIYE